MKMRKIPNKWLWHVYLLCLFILCKQTSSIKWSHIGCPWCSCGFPLCPSRLCVCPYDLFVHLCWCSIIMTDPYSLGYLGHTGHPLDLQVYVLFVPVINLYVSVTVLCSLVSVVYPPVSVLYAPVGVLYMPVSDLYAPFSLRYAQGRVMCIPVGIFMSQW